VVVRRSGKNYGRTKRDERKGKQQGKVQNANGLGSTTSARVQIVNKSSGTEETRWAKLHWSRMDAFSERGGKGTKVRGVVTREQTIDDPGR